MSSEAISTDLKDEDSSCGLLLRDIEEISKALYLDKTPSKISKSNPNNSVTIQDLTIKDKKSSLWNWKPLKALTHIRNHRIGCYFFLHVHTIQGLPPNFDGHELSVMWSRKNDALGTQPSRAYLGMAEFEETLMHRCTVYGSSRTGPAKYEAKIFSLKVSVVGRLSNTEIGNHLIDLSRLLPLSMEELEWDNNMGISGKWTTSFSLNGVAKGANLNVSFGFSLFDGNSFEPGCFVKVPDISGFDSLGSFPRISANDFHEEVFPKQESELSDSVTLLYSKLNEFSGGKNEPDFDVIEQGIELPTNDLIKIEFIDVAEVFDSEDADFDDFLGKNSKIIEGHENEEHVVAFKPAGDSLLGMDNSKESLLISDDVSESIENDFLNMLTVDQIQEDYDLSFPFQSVEENQSLRIKRNAKLLENLETEALMQKWGLTENAFQYSPRSNSGGFGSPVYIPLEEPLRLPSIEEGVGPMIMTRDGGFLRSMSPLLFSNVVNSAKLIVQVSSPIVLPPSMGFTAMEILLRWASGGFEKMCGMVNELMPLEDVTGKTMRECSENVSCSNGDSTDSDYVLFEDLVPTAIANIEGFLIQGLEINSGMQDHESPSIVEDTLSDFDVDKLMEESLCLDEWIHLDSSEKFMMCFKVQLRDPFRNYEMVGPPMLALVHVEKESCGTRFKVSEVGLAGINGDEEVWGSKRQKQSGTRWLFSSGMAKSNKIKNLPISGAVKCSRSGSRILLWSICSAGAGEAGTWDERVALNVHVRNPDIVFSK